jgi:hypothetical protein
MSTIEEREEYLRNPFFTKHIYVLFALNIIFGCCSKYKEYWEDRHTGNRWLASIWSVSPHKQPPLDLSELKDVTIEFPSAYPVEVEHPIHYTESQHKVRRLKPNLDRQVEYHKGQSREEFVELHKRESEI